MEASDIIYYVFALAIFVYSIYRRSKNAKQPQTASAQVDYSNDDEEFNNILNSKADDIKKYEFARKETIKVDNSVPLTQSRIIDNQAIPTEVKPLPKVELNDDDVKANEIMRDFDPKKAVIYSEIFNKKEF